jgi:hypothetical protein
MPDYEIELTPQQERLFDQVRRVTGCRSIEEALQLLLDTVLPGNSSTQAATQQRQGGGKS